VNERRATLRGESPAETVMIGDRIVNLAERAYTAGIIDGEGTITLSRKHRNNTHSPEITVANTDLRLLEWLKKRLGGLIKKKVRKLPQHNQAYTWIVRNDRAIEVMKEIEDFLIIKRKHSELITRKYKACTPRNGKYTEELLSKKMELIAEIKKLNSR
jgi:hypothetical protein